MRVMIHYLAQVKEAAGVASEAVDLEAGASYQDAVRRAADRHGESFRRLLLSDSGQLHESILLFVGDEQIAWETPRRLQDGDALTVLSPMAGG